MKWSTTLITRLSSFLLCFLLVQQLAAQIPQQLNYQGAVRDDQGKAIANANIKIRLSIQDAGLNGKVHYSEERQVKTNLLGLYHIQIGSDGALTKTGDFTTIPWGMGPKSLRVDVDISDLGVYTLAGITPLVSVPYALYSKYAENGPPGAPGPAGANGISITNAIIDSQGHLILTLSDNSQVDAGLAKGPIGDIGPAGPQGPTGLAGATITSVSVDPNTGHLIVKLNDNSTVDAGSVIGPTGPSGPPGQIGPAGPIGPVGPAGLSVTGANIDSQGHLILTLSNNTQIDAGIAKGATGDPGPAGPAGPQGPQGEAGPTGMPVLTNSHIYVGDVNNLPIDVSMAGDASISNTGILTIADKAITENKIANDAVTNSKILNGSVSTDKIADGAVTLGKMAVGPPDQVFMTNSAGSPILSSFNNMGWSLTGNSGTSPILNFVGTTDDQPLSFKINNQSAGLINRSLGITFLGYMAGSKAGQLNSNTFIGAYSGKDVASSASENTFLGYFSGLNFTTGNFNTIIGSHSGIGSDAGNGNTWVGHNAGQNSGFSGNTVLLGRNSRVVGNLINAVAIGANATVSTSNSLVLGGTGFSALNVGIGISAPTEKLHIYQGNLFVSEGNADVSKGNLKIDEGIFSSTQTSAMTISTPIPNGIAGANPGAVPMTNVKGQVVADGANNANSYTMILVSFSNPTPYTAIPSVMITPANSTAADADYYVNSSVNGFSIFYRNKSIGLRDAAFNYWVIQ